jgi:sugar-specific transcriptional regulator TrmB
MLRILMDIGLTQTERRVYLYLTIKGPKSVRDLSEALNLNKQQLYRSLRKMQVKSIVNASFENPACFSAVPFDIVLDLFIRAKIEVAKNMMENKEELLSSWSSITEKDEEKS